MGIDLFRNEALGITYELSGSSLWKMRRVSQIALKLHRNDVIGRQLQKRKHLTGSNVRGSGDSNQFSSAQLIQLHIMYFESINTNELSDPPFGREDFPALLSCSLSNYLI